MKATVELENFWCEEDVADGWKSYGGEIVVVVEPDASLRPLAKHPQLLSAIAEEGTNEVLADLAEENGLDEIAAALRVNAQTIGELEDRVAGYTENFVTNERIVSDERPECYDDVMIALWNAIIWPMSVDVVDDDLSLADYDYFEILEDLFDGNVMLEIVNEIEVPEGQEPRESEPGVRYVTVSWDSSLPIEQRIDSIEIRPGPANRDNSDVNIATRR